MFNVHEDIYILKEDIASIEIYALPGHDMASSKTKTLKHKTYQNKYTYACSLYMFTVPLIVFWCIYIYIQSSFFVE